TSIGVNFSVDFSPSTVTNFVHGADATFIALDFDSNRIINRGSWQNGVAGGTWVWNGSHTLVRNAPAGSWAATPVNDSIRLASLNLFDIIGVNLYADYAVGFDYHIQAGLGIGTGGFYVAAG